MGAAREEPGVEGSARAAELSQAQNRSAEAQSAAPHDRPDDEAADFGRRPAEWCSWATASGKSVTTRSRRRQAQSGSHKVSCSRVPASS